MQYFAVSGETYKKFAKRYNIRLTKVVNGRRVYRPFSELKADIRAYEEKHIPDIKNGMYYGTQDCYAEMAIREQNREIKRRKKLKKPLKPKN